METVKIVNLNELKTLARSLHAAEDQLNLRLFNLCKKFDCNMVKLIWPTSEASSLPTSEASSLPTSEASSLPTSEANDENIKIQRKKFIDLLYKDVFAGTILEKKTPKNDNFIGRFISNGAEYLIIPVLKLGRCLAFDRQKPVLFYSKKKIIKTKFEFDIVNKQPDHIISECLLHILRARDRPDNFTNYLHISFNILKTDAALSPFSKKGFSSIYLEKLDKASNFINIYYEKLIFQYHDIIANFIEFDLNDFIVEGNPMTSELINYLESEEKDAIEKEFKEIVFGGAEILAKGFEEKMIKGKKGG